MYCPTQHPGSTNASNHKSLSQALHKIAEDSFGHVVKALTYRRSDGVVCKAIHCSKYTVWLLPFKVLFLDSVLYLLGKVAGPLWRVKDLVVEHREVEGQAQPDGVGRGEINQRDVL